MRSRFVCLGLFILSLSCMSAWADNFALFSTGPTTATLTFSNVLFEPEVLSSTAGNVINVYGYAGSSGGSSSCCGNVFEGWEADFGAISGWAGMSKGTAHSQADIREFATTELLFRNILPIPYSLQIGESLSTQGGSATGFLNGYWQGMAGYQSGLVLSLPYYNGPSLEIACGGGVYYSYLPTSSCETYFGAPLSASNIWIFAPGNSMSAFDSFVVPAYGTLDLTISAYLEGFADSDYKPPVTPEPGTLTLLGSGLVVLAATIRKRLAPTIK